ncbi:plasmid pRiA4b ORF-3 family protein [Rivularia sp. UHCC 0363]|uniref:plasmid pRiA4b ORF-3 family protein n=1 Tax=Rivularia sp. UHCC 0363 TaxID=3110244 RepID=UPI002B1F5FA6|nr:plasmid pRiA4b ORF-3 family protein [Rivularia sp. UHCC 0363]MEA5598822.1 plasmid pRiA4b ORF-3 family protein [Rivularia sp. UHCC 0363]
MPLSVPPPAEIYQLKIALIGISPLIWRRLLVHSASSIAELHHIIQIAMGWEDIHLHRFIIHSQHYGLYRAGGICFDSDPQQVKLSHFGFRRNEKFRYDYDFGDAWQHEIRVEAILPVAANQLYPICTAGKRSAPPEDSGGVDCYLERQQAAPIVALDLLSDFLAHGTPLEAVEQATVRELLPWLNLEQFERRAVNRRLRLYAEGDEAWRIQL